MKSYVATVTPEMASEWLKKNANNRVLRPRVVDKYVRHLREGEWQLTHQGIAFDERGLLLDGQHRLTAVVVSGVSAKMLVSEGVKRQTFAFLDNGAMRSAGDRLGCDPHTAEIVNMGARIVFSNQGTPAQLKRVHDSIGVYVEKLLSASASRKKYFSSAPMCIGAIAHLIDGSDEEYVLSTYRNLVLGEISALSPCAQSLVKQFLLGSVAATNREDTQARSVVVFDPNKRNLSKLIVKDATNSLAWLRSVLRARVLS